MPTITPVSGSTSVVAGGSLLASGDLSAYTQFSGPFLIEEQSLTVEYARVPSWMIPAVSAVSGTIFNSTIDSLSGVNTRQMVPGGTKLVCIAYAQYSRRKDYGVYTTTGYQQPQKFSIDRQADSNGETYGSGASGVKYVLGPAGRVITSQKYIRRVPWNDSTDTETSKSIVGCTELYRSGLAEGSTWGGAMYGADQYGYMYNFTVNNDSQVAHSFTYTGDVQPLKGWTQYYPLQNRYAATQESDAAFINFMNIIANDIKTAPTLNSSTGYYFGQLLKASPVYNVDFNFSQSQNAYPTTAINNFAVTMFPYIAEYSAGRHDYT